MNKNSGNSFTDQELGGTEQLAQFFPGTARVAIRATLKPRSGRGNRVEESVIVEFVNIENAIFSSGLPLNFADIVRLTHQASKQSTDARVVAMQYHEGRKAVAVQFVNPQPYWVSRP